MTQVLIEAKPSFLFANQDLYHKVCGIGDSRLRDLEKQLQTKIIPRGLQLIFQGDDDLVHSAELFFSVLQTELLQRPDLEYMDSEDLDTIIQNIYPRLPSAKLRQSDRFTETNGSDRSDDLDRSDNSNPRLESIREMEGDGDSGWSPKHKIFVTYKGKPIFPRTVNQELFCESLKNQYISFALGPAGTGKTFLSIAVACRMMQAGEVDRLVLTRPAVEAGESLGFLPGDLAQKVNPYLRPIYDALHDCIGFEKTQEYLSIGKIEIAPIAFMRGRTLSNSFIILDEAQNCTLPQLKMFLTRFGKNSRMSISGDITQIDLENGKSGLEKATRILQGSRGIGFVTFTEKDITRHPIVSVIVKKFEGMGL